MSSGATDCAGNSGEGETRQVARTNQPIIGDWILNEILFDAPSGGSDYVEIRNVSSSYLDLKDIRIGNTGEWNDAYPESYPVEPGGIVLFTENPALTFRDFPRGRLENFVEWPIPTFGADSGTVRIGNLKGTELEKFSYSSDLHAPVLDETKGVSLERISANLPAEKSDSWQSASADAGYGTPGYENSNDRNFELKGNFSSEPKVFTPNGDGNKDFTLISYELEEDGFYGNLRIYNAGGVMIKELASSANLGAKGFWKWDGRNEAGRTASLGLYLAVLELNKQGKQSQSIRIPLAIAEDR
jgi:hypothetical protein